MSAGDPHALAAILAQLQKSPGDAAAWARFFERSWKTVLLHSRMLLGPSAPIADAEDVAQEVFWLLSRAVRNGRLRVPDDDLGVLHLLKTMARNSANDLWRREHSQRRDIRRRVSLPEEGIAAQEAASPQSQLEYKESVERLLAMLGPLDRQLLTQLLTGDSLDEIARKVGKSVKTIRRHHRFIQQLAARMEASARKHRPA